MDYSEFVEIPICGHNQQEPCGQIVLKKSVHDVIAKTVLELHAPIVVSFSCIAGEHPRLMTAQLYNTRISMGKIISTGVGYEQEHTLEQTGREEPKSQEVNPVRRPHAG